LPSPWENFERLVVCLEFLWDARSLDVRKEAAFDEAVLRVTPSRSVSEPSNKMPMTITAAMTRFADMLKPVSEFSAMLETFAVNASTAHRVVVGEAV
jgi:hypothetical protein